MLRDVMRDDLPVDVDPDVEKRDYQYDGALPIWIYLPVSLGPCSHAHVH